MANSDGSKSGGRTKGTPNKVDSATKQFLKDIIENNQDKIKKELATLKGKPFLDAMFSFMEYVQPKLNRTEIKGEVDNNLNITIGE
jgi:hypothetical protein